MIINKENLEVKEALKTIYYYCDRKKCHECMLEKICKEEQLTIPLLEDIENLK